MSETVIDVERIAKELGLQKWKLDGDELTARCPNPNHDDKNPSWSFNIESQFFNCWACGFSGKGLASLYLKCGFNIPEWITELPEKPKRKNRISASDSKQPPVPVEVRDSWLKWLTANPYDAYMKLKDRGILKKSIKEFQIGYQPKHDITFFPCLNRSGNLLGWAERCDSWANRYRLMPEGISREILLFGTHLIDPDETNTIYVVEGPIDAMKMWQWGFKAVAVLGSNLYEKQAQWLIDNAQQVIAIPDNDKAGLKLRYDIIGKLKGKVRLSGVNLPDGIKDIGQNECTKEIVTEAIKNRIKITE